MGQHGAELPGRGSGASGCSGPGGPCSATPLSSRSGDPALEQPSWCGDSPPGPVYASGSSRAWWGGRGEFGQSPGSDLCGEPGRTLLGGGPMVHIPGKALFPSTSSAWAPACWADPRFSHCRRTWPASTWCGHCSWDPSSTLHTLPPGRKYENAVPTVINMMNLLCRLPRKIPFRGGDGCAPGALRVATPLQPIPEKLMGTPGR